jgi:hypothetical protein
MRDKCAYWGATVLAFMALMLVVVGIVLHGQNLALQTEVNQRAQQLTAAQNFAQLFQGLTQNLAVAAVEKNDAALRALLEAEGLTITAAAPKAEVADKAPRAKK